MRQETRCGESGIPESEQKSEILARGARALRLIQWISEPIVTMNLQEIIDTLAGLCIDILYH